MVEVSFLGPIKQKSLALDINNVSQLKEILQKDETMKEWLHLCAIAINDKLVFDINTELKNGDKVAILPPVSGG